MGWDGWDGRDDDEMIGTARERVTVSWDGGMLCRGGGRREGQTRDEFSRCMSSRVWDY
jgi:hypothetical protein